MRLPPCRRQGPQLQFVEAQIRYQLLQLRVLLAKVFQFTYRARLEPTLLRLRAINRLLRDALHSCNVCSGTAQFILLRRRYDMLLRKPLALPVVSSCWAQRI